MNREIRVLAIDDEPLALQQLAAYIKKMPFLCLVGECQSALDARELMETEVVDAIFCDINMPDLSGMDFVKQLPVQPLIVFTTAYSEYAIEGFKVAAVDYLLKPFGLMDFQRAALRVKERFEQKNSIHPTGNDNSAQEPSAQGQENPAVSDASKTADDSIFVKTEYKTVRVSISDIVYVEGMSEYLKLHLESQPRPIITLLSMKKLEDFLPDTFMRIHRSYIVNLQKVKEVNKNRVILNADTYLPIGESYKEQLQAWIDERFLGK